MRFDGLGVLITGASSGIGEALAREIARRGGRLALAARRADRLGRLVRSLREAGATAAAVPCDVSRPREVAAMVDRTRGALGRVDVLINNAGICAYGATERTTARDFRRLFDVNLAGPWYAMQAVIPEMRARGHGVIVNVASVAALHGTPYLGAYGASKAALAALTQSVRAELAGDGIRLVVAYPGYTRTEIYTSERKLGGARRPAGQYASAERVARVIARGIERGRSEIVLSPEGRALAMAKRIAPFAVEFAMRRLAVTLRQPIEVNDAQAQAADHRLVPESR